MYRELERTFLARRLPAEAHAALHQLIEDYYLASGTSDLPRLRARRVGSALTLTKKIQGMEPSEHVEHCIDLDQVEFEAVCASAIGKLRKDRLNLFYAGTTPVIDIFRDSLYGLVLIEFEFADRAEMETFEAPDICLVDVTDEKFVAGGSLATTNLIGITPELERLGYSPIFAEHNMVCRYS